MKPKDREALKLLYRKLAECEENIRRTDFTWQEKVAIEKELHDLYCKAYGKAEAKDYLKKGTARPSEADERWSSKKTAEKFNIAEGVMREDLMLAEACQTDPDLCMMPTKAAALRELKKKRYIEKNKGTINNSDAVSIHLGDCIECLKALPDKSVGCVVTDPPYGIDYIEQTNSGNDKTKTCHLYSANKNFKDDKESALNTLEQVCEELKRVCKADAHLYFFFAMTNYPDVRFILEKYFFIDPIPLIWVKPNFVMNGRDTQKKYLMTYEPIFFCVNEIKDRILNNVSSPNVLKYQHDLGKMHPTQKPVEILKYLILNSSQEGETILDPFMGSGSTIIAALETKRKGIGIEIDKDYFEIAQARINEEVRKNDNN
jgi:DNA modification methylase